MSCIRIAFIREGSNSKSLCNLVWNQIKVSTAASNKKIRHPVFKFKYSPSFQSNEETNRMM